MFKFTTQNLLYIVVALLVVVYFFPSIFGLVEGMCGGCGSSGDLETFTGEFDHMTQCDGSENCKCGDNHGAPESFSTCYSRKQIYLNSCDPDEPTAHADVNLEKRWGKLYININANLPYVLGGVMHTMWGAYHAFLVDSRTKRSINIGSLVRHGDRFYKLSTELLGDYNNYNEIWVYQVTEDYSPKMVLRGSISSQQCSSL